MCKSCIQRVTVGSCHDFSGGGGGATMCTAENNPLLRGVIYLALPGTLKNIELAQCKRPWLWTAIRRRLRNIFDIM